LLTVLLKLEEDNGGKRKAAHYPQGTPPQRDHLYDWQEFLC